ncbi:MAG: DUF2891 domain-containing protein [Sciscionella sp.]
MTTQSSLPAEIGADDVNRLLGTAVANVQRDYPNHWTHFISSPDELVPQRELHPVFAGSYDWHSCVHQTWLAVRLLRLHPDLPGAATATKALDKLITPEGCRIEAEFFDTPMGGHWERPYGWAWLLLLNAELAAWDVADARRWGEALRPLATALRAHWLAWISSARRPIRTGTHTNTAFATTLVLDTARTTGDTELEQACVAAALRWYGDDAGYGGFEPDAADFLSPALAEADLMRRALPEGQFTSWFEGLLPDLEATRWQVLTAPVEVDDPSGPYGSHLTGLALSRAWCWRSVGEALPWNHRYRPLVDKAAAAHAATGSRYVFGYGYAAEHWLGTFVTYLHLGALRD